MDQSTPNTQPVGQPQSPTTPTEAKKNQTKTVAGIVTAIVVLLFAGVVLIKGFPTLQPKISKIVPRPTPTPIALPCPSQETFCKEGKNIVKDNIYQGIGTTLASGSPLYAVFDGKITTRSVIQAKGGKFFIISLVNNQSGLTAFYYYTGQPSFIADIKKGEVIASVSAQPIPNYPASNLIFSVKKDGIILSQNRLRFE